MYIKAWNGHDLDVFKITPNLKKFYTKEVKQLFSADEQKQLKKIARLFAEEMSLVFANNLKQGWENKLLNNGRVTTKSNRQLTSKEEIIRALDFDGQIKFHTYRKNGSAAFIEKILKPAHLHWD